MSEQLEQQRFAVLFDGENAQASLLTQILAEVSKVGLITIKRIYGDWTTTSMNSWKESLHKYAIQPIQQFRYTTGKNATRGQGGIGAAHLKICHSSLEGTSALGAFLPVVNLMGKLELEIVSATTPQETTQTNK